MSHVAELGSPGTLLGQLQRGLGRGIAAVARHPRQSAREALLTCLTADPRWHPQLEARADYFARVCLGAPDLCATVIALVREGLDSDVRTVGEGAVDAVGHLHLRGFHDATQLLRDLVQASTAPHSALQYLIDPRSPEVPLGLGKLLHGQPETWIAGALDACHALHVDLVTSDDAYDRSLIALWNEVHLREQPLNREFPAADSLSEWLEVRANMDVLELANALAKEKSTQMMREVEACAQRAGPDQFLCIAALMIEPRDTASQVLASVVQGRRRTSVLEDRLMRFAISRGAPAILLPLAARWVEASVPPVRFAGEVILEHWATRNEGALLGRCIEAAYRCDDMLRLSRLATALRSAGQGLDEAALLELMVCVPFSVARASLYDALRVIAPNRARELASECLLDSEWRVRRHACGALVPASPEVRHVLELSAGDPLEVKEVRVAAANALKRRFKSATMARGAGNPHTDALDEHPDSA